jgi:hypothetical protein
LFPKGARELGTGVVIISLIVVNDNDRRYHRPGSHLGLVAAALCRHLNLHAATWRGKLAAVEAYHASISALMV